MVSFVVAMNRVDVVHLVVDLVDVDLDIDLVDVDLDVDLVDVGLVDVVPGCIVQGRPPLYFGLLAPSCISGFWPPPVLARAGPRLYFWLPCNKGVSTSRTP